jgi:hypothetical protein
MLLRADVSSACTTSLGGCCHDACRSQEVAAGNLCSLAAERDDLQALLLATLQRLEGVEAVVAAADATSAAMEEKVGFWSAGTRT